LQKRPVFTSVVIIVPDEYHLFSSDGYFLPAG